jgi:hypothetical protein
MQNRDVLGILAHDHSEGSHHRRIREEIACPRPHVRILKFKESGLGHMQTPNMKNCDAPLVR